MQLAQYAVRICPDLPYHEGGVEAVGLQVGLVNDVQPVVRAQLVPAQGSAKRVLRERLYVLA